MCDSKFKKKFLAPFCASLNVNILSCEIFFKDSNDPEFLSFQFYDYSKDAPLYKSETSIVMCNMRKINQTLNEKYSLLTSRQIILLHFPDEDEDKKDTEYYINKYGKNKIIIFEDDYEKTLSKIYYLHKKENDKNIDSVRITMYS